MENEKLDVKNESRGTYSINRTFLSFVIFTILFVFFSSSELYIKSSHIQNQYIRTIVMAGLKPIANASEYLGISQTFIYLRNTLLESAKLKNEVDWDDFYYIAENDEANVLDSSVEIDDKKNSKLEKKESLKEATQSKKKDKDKISDDKIPENEKENATNIENAPQKENDVAQQEASNEVPADQEAPFVPSPYIYDETNPFHLLMIGDSQMYGLANGLKKLTSGQDSIEITDISIHSSGFVRGDYYNWEKKLENVFKSKTAGYYHAVVILLGMNDYQDIYSGNSLFVRETKEWEVQYRDKIIRVINLLLLNTKKVYWLGMPVVRRASYNDDLQYIEKVQARVANEYNHAGLTRIALSSIAPGDGVPYTDTIQREDGKIIRLMKADGIHYTISGGQYIMEGFLKKLYKEWYIKEIPNNQK